MSHNTHTDILLAGAAAAFTVDLLVYPLDTIKTRMQSPEYRRRYIDGATRTVNKRLLFRGLYQGVGSVIIATLPSSGAFFTTYEATKSGLQRLNRRGNSEAFLLPSPVIHATASSIAELVSCLILTPAEVLKQNAQMVNEGGSKRASSRSLLFSGASSSLKVLRRFDRPSQLWRGYGALVARNLPFTALQFPLFEQLKKTLLAYRDARRPTSPSKAGDGQSSRPVVETAAITAVSAGSAGAVAAVVTTPIDVVKTRIMLEAGASSTKENTQRRSNSGWTIARNILREEGAKTLWRGGALRAVWTFLASGLYLGAYETGRVSLEERRLRREQS